MANHPNRTRAALIRRHMRGAGCDARQVRAGMAWASAQRFRTAREGYILAMSRVQYSDEQLAAGMRFTPAPGTGPVEPPRH